MLPMPKIHKATNVAASGDVLTQEQRSFCMSNIKAKNTKPELVVRSLLFSRGYRYRLHDRKLPGTPDIVFRGSRKAILVHGCFWHMHDCQYGRVKPKNNALFWETKRKETVQRDSKTITALEALGWSVLVIWECEIRDKAALMNTLEHFLESHAPTG